jgi:hypothetical protein
MDWSSSPLSGLLVSSRHGQSARSSCQSTDYCGDYREKGWGPVASTSLGSHRLGEAHREGRGGESLGADDPLLLAVLAITGFGFVLTGLTYISERK